MIFDIFVINREVFCNFEKPKPKPMKKTLFYSIALLPLIIFAKLISPKTLSTTNDEIVLEETFLTLDSVWTPGKRQKFSLHPFDNYLWIKEGNITFIVDAVRGKSFRGPITGIKSVEKNGLKQTSFTVRNASIKVEITDLGNNRFEIFTYNYLAQYERMFSAYWVDVTKVKFEDDK